MDWNKLMNDSVEEFKPKRTVVIPIRQPRKEHRMFGQILIGVLMNVALFVCWLTNQDTPAYLIGNSLWSIGYGLWMLQRA